MQDYAVPSDSGAEAFAHLTDADIEMIFGRTRGNPE